MQYIFYTEVIGGQLIDVGPETKEIAFFNLKDLPLNIVPLRKRQIKDFFNGNKEETYNINSFNILFFLEKILKRTKLI